MAHARLVAEWMLVGFVHGVMNTDNMAISGETMDYGPCAFMEVYDPNAVYSSVDDDGRYRYSSQPLIAEWNLARFAEALVPLLHDDPEQAAELAGSHSARSADSTTPHGPPACAPSSAWLRAPKRSRPLSSTSCSPCSRRATSTARRSSVRWARPRGETPSRREDCSSTSTFDTWLADWLALRPDAEVMDRANPVYVPRNHLVEEALDAAVGGDLEPVERLLGAVTAPFVERPGLERYAEAAPQDFGTYRTDCGT